MLQKRREFFEDIDKEKIGKILDEIKPVLKHRQDLYYRYIRKNSPYEMMKSDKPADEITELVPIVVPLEAAEVREFVSYCAGKAPQFTVAFKTDEAEQAKATAFQAKINHITRYIDIADLHQTCAKHYAIYATSIGYIYENSENEIMVVFFDPKQSAVFYEYEAEPYPVACVRTWDETDNDGEELNIIEIITSTFKRKYNIETGELIPFVGYDNGVRTTITEEVINWNDGDVPVIEIANEDGIASFEPGIGHIEAIERHVSNMDTSSYYNAHKAKLKVTGIAFDDETRLEDEKRIMGSSILAIKGAVDIGWLLKPGDNSEELAAINYHYNGFAGATDYSGGIFDENINNVISGTALKERRNIENKAANFDRPALKGYKRMWEIIVSRINEYEKTDYDYLMIDIHFPRNEHRNKSADIATAKQIRDDVSYDTFVDMLNQELDANAEKAKRANEKVAISDFNALEKLYDSGLIDEEYFINRLLIPDNEKEMLLSALKGQTETAPPPDDDTDTETETAETTVETVAA